MQKIFRVGLALAFVACLSLNALPVVAETRGSRDYNFTYTEYAEYVDDFSYIEEKNTTSSIFVENYNSTGGYHVMAYGSYSAEQGSPLADASGGHILQFSAGGYQSGELINYVVEWGYHAAAIRGIYQGDNYFYAEGNFTTDY